MCSSVIFAAATYFFSFIVVCDFLLGAWLMSIARMAFVLMLEEF